MREDILLVFLYVGISHILSLPFLILKLPPVPIYVVAGLVIHYLGLPAPNTLLNDMVDFLLVFVALEAGLSTKIRRGDLGRITVITAVNVLISTVTTFALIYSVTRDLFKSLLISLLISNTATEGVLGLSKYVKYKADAEAALEMSIGDDLAVIMVSVAVIILKGGVGASALLAVLLSLTISVWLVKLVSEKVIDRELLSSAVLAILLIVTGLTADKVNPLVGGYLIGMVLSSTRSSGDPLLKMARHVEAVREGLGLFNYGIAIPLVFMYIGLRADLATLSPLLLTLGLVGATMGKFLSVAALNKLALLPLVNPAEVAALATIRGSLESAIALTALKLGVLSSREFGTLIIVSLLTQPVSIVLLFIARRMIK